MAESCPQQQAQQLHTYAGSFFTLSAIWTRPSLRAFVTMDRACCLLIGRPKPRRMMNSAPLFSDRQIS